MKWMCSLLLLVLAVPAAGQDTIALYVDNPVSGLMRYGHLTHGVPFDIVAIMNAAEPSAGAEFVMTELAVEFPGVFKLLTTTINNTGTIGGDQTRGEYVIPFADCLEPGTYELVRVQYGDFSGLITENFLVQLRGLREGDSVPSLFGGEPGYVDCEDGKHILQREDWVDVLGCFPPGTPDEIAGGCVLNLLCVPNETITLSALKSRY